MLVGTEFYGDREAFDHGGKPSHEMKDINEALPPKDEGLASDGKPIWKSPQYDSVMADEDNNQVDYSISGGVTLDY